MSMIVDQERNIEVRIVAFDQVDAMPNNPNLMSEANANLLRRRIEKVGVIQLPIVRRLDGGRFGLVDGQQRITQAKASGLDRCAMIIVDMSEAEARAHRIAMNNATTRGVMDSRRVMEEIRAIADQVTPDDLAYSDRAVDALLKMSTDDGPTVDDMLSEAATSQPPPTTVARNSRLIVVFTGENAKTDKARVAAYLGDDPAARLLELAGQ